MRPTTIAIGPRPGPDYPRAGTDGVFRQPQDVNNNIDRADYGDYGITNLRSFGVVPREFPHTNYPPNWIRTDSSREGLSSGARASHPDEGATSDPFGHAVPNHYPYAGIASAARRGRFVGRGPKGYHRSDARIEEEISDRLMTHPDIDASDMEIRVENGTVILTGTAEDRHEKRLAEYIAEDAIGVNDVENRLKVRHGFWAAVMGERAAEKQLATDVERDADVASREAGRTSSARNSARREVDAR